MSSWIEETNKILRDFRNELRNETPITEEGITEPTAEQIRQKEFSESVYTVLSGLERLLIDKNRKYGDSALNPARIFSKANAEEQLLVRIDDKLNRIKNQQNDEDEDVVQDLIGYLILLTIARERNA